MKKMKVLSGILATVTTLSMVGGMLACAENRVGGFDICIGNTSMNGQPLSQRTDFDYYAPMAKEEIDKLSDEDAYEILIAYEYRTGDISSHRYYEIPYNEYLSFMILGKERAEEFHKSTREECEKYLKALNMTPQQAVNALKNSKEWEGLSVRIMYLYKDGQTPTQIEGFDYYGHMIYWETQRLTGEEAYDIINAYDYRTGEQGVFCEKKVVSDDYVNFKNNLKNPQEYWKNIREGIDFYLEDLECTPQMGVEMLKNSMFGGTSLGLIDVYCGKRNQNQGDVDGMPKPGDASSEFIAGDASSVSEPDINKRDEILNLIKENATKYIDVGSNSDWLEDDEFFSGGIGVTGKNITNIIRFLKLSPEEVASKIADAKAKGEKVAWDVIYAKSEQFKKAYGELKKGDIKIDGIVNSSDALEVLKQIVGINDFPTEKIEISDVNGDGRLDTLDALAILKMVVGL